MTDDIRFFSTLTNVTSLIDKQNDYCLLLKEICLEISKGYKLRILVNSDDKVYFDNRLSSVEKNFLFFEIEDINVRFFSEANVIDCDDVSIKTFEIVLKLVLKNLRKEEIERKEKEILDIKNGLDKLSFTELTAITKIFAEFEDEQKTIIASNVAQKHNLTRSSIVNAIRKLESAMLIESYSLGVKGTHIKIINSYFLKEIKKLI